MASDLQKNLTFSGTKLTDVNFISEKYVTPLLKRKPRAGLATRRGGFRKQFK